MALVCAIKDSLAFNVNSACQATMAQRASLATTAPTTEACAKVQARCLAVAMGRAGVTTHSPVRSASLASLVCMDLRAT